MIDFGNHILAGDQPGQLLRSVTLLHALHQSPQHLVQFDHGRGRLRTRWPILLRGIIQVRQVEIKQARLEFRGCQYCRVDNPGS